MRHDQLLIGEIYGLKHSRKGSAAVRIVDVLGEWIDVILVSGTLRGMGSGSIRKPGDSITVRCTRCKFSTWNPPMSLPPLKGTIEASG